MPTAAELIADQLLHQLAMTVDQIIEAYRGEAHDTIIADADLIEDAYRRLGDFVHLIRPKREAAA